METIINNVLIQLLVLEKIFEAIGSTAGIGGISLGVLLFVFKDFIRKNIFPTLSKDQSFRLFQRIIMYTFIIAIIAILAFTLLESNESKIKHSIKNGKDSIKIETNSPNSPAIKSDGNVEITYNGNTIDKKEEKVDSINIEEFKNN